MNKHAIKLIAFIFIANIFGCATPRGMEWHKESASTETTNADIHDCKVNTFLWWPFDTLYRCMHRRGYKLIGENEVPQNKEILTSNIDDNHKKLMELKSLKEHGLVTNEEYEQKRKKYLSSY